MNKHIKLFSTLIILALTACGPTGDTEGLKQTVEKNELNISSVIIKPKYTQTIDPVTTPPANPKYYFDHNDAEQLEVVGITESGDEIILDSVTWSITDDSDTAGATVISNSGLLTMETLDDNQTKDVLIQVEFATLTSSADIVISSYPLSSDGLSIKLNDELVTDTTPTVIVCDTNILTTEAIFDDGSIRDVTSKIDWSAAITDDNAKFVTTVLNTAIFSSHTNATYTVTPDYKEQGTATVSLDVTQTGFSNLLIDSSSVSIQPDATHIFAVTADIDNGSGNVNTTVSTQAKWSSADKDIFTVDDTGVITGITEGGPVDLTAQCGSAIETASITVDLDKIIVSIEIRDENGNSTNEQIMFVNDKVNLTLHINYSDGSSQDVTIDDKTSWTIRTLVDQGTPITIDNANDKGLVGNWKDLRDDLEGFDPTEVCGDDEEVIDRCYSFHNFGRPKGKYMPRDKGGHPILGTKYRISTLHAALLNSQMDRVEEQTGKRSENADYLTARIKEIPGIIPRKDYKETTRTAYYNYALRYEKEYFDDVPRDKFIAAMRAEGIPCSWGLGVLEGHPINREGLIEEALNSHIFRRIYSQERLKKYREQNQCPESDQLSKEVMGFSGELLLGAKKDMDDIADAIFKICENKDKLG